MTAPTKDAGAEKSLVENSYDLEEKYLWQTQRSKSVSV